MQFNTIRVFNIYITVDKTKSNRSSTQPQMYEFIGKLAGFIGKNL